MNKEMDGKTNYPPAAAPNDIVLSVNTIDAGLTQTI